MTHDTDQIRKLKNTVKLAGALAELGELKTGEKDGIKWISFDGVIQCGETSVSNVRFRTFSREITSQGKESKAYKNALSWYNNAVSLVKCGGDMSKVTMVELVGSLQDNMYWSTKANKVVEDVMFSMGLFNKFTDYAANITLEGYVCVLGDEVSKKTDEPTGRQRMAILSRDSYGNNIKFDRIVVPNTEVVEGGCPNMVQAFSDYDLERGSTAMFYVDLIPHIGESAPSRGVGICHDTPKSYIERVLIGFDNTGYEDEDKKIPDALAKKMLSERDAKRAQIEADAEGGGPAPAVGVSSSKKPSGVGKITPIEEDDLDDMPF